MVSQVEKILEEEEQEQRLPLPAIIYEWSLLQKFMN
jgi:hypothetical protein